MACFDLCDGMGSDRMDDLPCLHCPMCCSLFGHTMFALLPAMFHIMEKQHWTFVFTMFTHEIDEHEIQPTKTRKHKEITIDPFLFWGFHVSRCVPCCRLFFIGRCADRASSSLTCLMALRRSPRWARLLFCCCISLLGHVWISLSSTCGIVKYKEREREIGRER